MEPAPAKVLYRFGVFDADPSTGELRKQGMRIRLQEQPFQVLLLLLERRGDLVTREELRERLWPADTFVDFDHSLNTAVNKIREVLNDSASSPRFVETLARRGYRFLGEVKWVVPTHEVSADHFEHTASSRSSTDLPTPRRGIPRALFALIQAMYLIFYVEALLRWQAIDRIAWLASGAPVILIGVLVTGAVGIPIRFYLLSAVAFD